MLSEKFNKEQSENLMNYLNTNFPEIDDIDYTFTEDGSALKLNADFTIPEKHKVINAIKYIEDSINTRLLTMVSINGNKYMLYKFNKN